MSGDFNLEYGERVHIRIRGSDGEVYNAKPGDGNKADILIPYIADALEFGIHVMHPLDYQNGQYPKNIEDLKLTEDIRLSGIKLLEKTSEEGLKLLHGIQLFFIDGSKSPMFRG